jgi:hypothetical protein
MPRFYSSLLELLIMVMFPEATWKGNGKKQQMIDVPVRHGL